MLGEAALFLLDHSYLLITAGGCINGGS